MPCLGSCWFYFLQCWEWNPGLACLLVKCSLSEPHPQPCLSVSWPSWSTQWPWALQNHWFLQLVSSLIKQHVTISLVYQCSANWLLYTCPYWDFHWVPIPSQFHLWLVLTTKGKLLKCESEGNKPKTPWPAQCLSLPNSLPSSQPRAPELTCSSGLWGEWSPAWGSCPGTRSHTRLLWLSSAHERPWPPSSTAAVKSTGNHLDCWSAPLPAWPPHHGLIGHHAETYIDGVIRITHPHRLLTQTRVLSRSSGSTLFQVLTSS